MGFLNPFVVMAFAIFVFGSLVNNALATMRSQLGMLNINFPPVANQKIVGGLPGRDGDFPYQLSLRFHGYHFCGGSLTEIEGHQFAVTAAHCVEGGIENLNALSIVAGDLTISDFTGNEQVRHARSITVHEKYGSSQNLDNDIALIFLDKPYELNDYVDVVSLPEENEEFYGNLTVSGWGTLYIGGDISNTLQYVVMPVVNHSICQEKWKHHPQYPMEIGDGILCSGVESGNMSACNGDSGGPAVYNTNKHLAGIVSFGDPICGHPEYPGGFTNVAYYKTWIEEEVKKFITFGRN